MPERRRLAGRPGRAVAGWRSDRTAPTKYSEPVTRTRSDRSAPRWAASRPPSIVRRRLRPDARARGRLAARSSDGSARGEGGVQQITGRTSPPGARRSMAAGSRPVSMPTTRVRPAVDRELLVEHAAAASAPSGLWAPSMMTSGLRRHDLEAARHPDLGERLAGPRRGPAARPKNASTAARATAALSPWWAPWSGRNRSSTRWSGVRSVDERGRRPRGRWSSQSKSGPRSQRARRAAPRGTRRRRCGVGLAEHEVASGP